MATEQEKFELDEQREVDAFVRTFLRRECQERYLVRRYQLFADMSQGLNARLRRDRAVDVPRSLPAEFLLSFLRDERVPSHCFFLTNYVDTPEGKRSIKSAVDGLVNLHQAGIASITIGALALYQGEDPGRYVLSTNAALLKRLSLRIEAAVKAQDAARVPRKRSGSR